MARDIENGSRSPDRECADRPVELRRETGKTRGPNRAEDIRLGRNYAYSLSESELAAMFDIGRFRTVAVGDLSRIRYNGKNDEMRADLQSLGDQGLLEMRTLCTGAKSGRVAVAVLTKRGKDVLEREGGSAGKQQFYSGFVKPAEIAHDAAIYLMYQLEGDRIARAGGRIQRIVLDYELKRKVYSPLAKARMVSPAEYSRRQTEIATEHGLKVIRGRIVLPDLRIEYETGNGESVSIDLELATHHYHGTHLTAKAAAGFKMYAPASSAGHLRSVLEEREITTEIFSL